MDLPTLDRVLRQTLEDHRLSRGERKALQALLADAEAGEADLAVFRSHAFKVARSALYATADRQILGWLEGVLKLLMPDEVGAGPGKGVARACFSPQENCPRRIAELIQRARRTVDICVFTITDDRIADTIRRVHERGTKVRIISDNDKQNDAGSDIARLRGEGVAVRLDRSEHHMHHKFALFDGELLLTGSYNWTRSAALNNEENFIVTPDPRLVDRFARLFNRMWRSLA